MIKSFEINKNIPEKQQSKNMKFAQYGRMSDDEDEEDDSNEFPQLIVEHLNQFIESQQDIKIDNKDLKKYFETH